MPTAARYLKHQLTEATGLSLDEIRSLTELELFPSANCVPSEGPSWDREAVDGWVRELHENYKHSEAVEFGLGYRQDGWATSDERSLANPAASHLAKSIINGTVSAWMINAYGIDPQNIAMIFHILAGLFLEFWKQSR
jgi:hypothetical protein